MLLIFICPMYGDYLVKVTVAAPDSKGYREYHRSELKRQASHTETRTRVTSLLATGKRSRESSKSKLMWKGARHRIPPGAVGDLVEMKIVDEPSSFGLNNGYGVSNTQQEETLKLRVQPANFSGPAHFKRLLGRCFSSVIKDYKYNFCPFSNITQHEQGIHWNPYKGVLGVWQEWEVINNTFAAMIMRDGDACGNVYRSVQVTFMCGNHSEIVNVSEPHTCQYQIVFMTPLVCHKDSMLVYPTLNQDLQKQWNQLEGQMVRGELTDKGYKKGLARILEKAGIFMSTAIHHQLVKKSEEVEEAKRSEGDFDSLETCKREYKKVQERLKTLISQTGGPQNNELELTVAVENPDLD